jgi:hypothetical protein
MNFYLISQDGCGAWGQQLTLDLKTAGARTYEPAAFLPSATFENAMLLLRFYQYTGDKKFLNKVPDAIKWLEDVSLDTEMSEGGKYTHSTFVEVGTNKPIYVHRKGSNVKYGYYYVDYNDEKLLEHYHGKCRIPLEMLKTEYNRIAALLPDELTKDSPLKAEAFKVAGTPQRYYELNRESFSRRNEEPDLKEIINSLDSKDRWLVQNGRTSNPYIGDGVKQEPTDKYASTDVGDETDTSPYDDTSDTKYISTAEYIKNMKVLINYINSVK